MITIALIDKHPILRTGLSIFLRKLFYDIIILESENISAFYQSYPDKNLDLIILGNIMNTSTKELDFIYELKKGYRIETVIVLAESTDRITITHYLKAGVKGYILKQATIAELTICVNNVLNGKRFLCNEAIEVLIENYSSTSNKKAAKVSRPISQPNNLHKS